MAAQLAEGPWCYSENKKVEKCWKQMGEQYTKQVGLREAFKMTQNLSLMLVLAIADEALAAKGFWEGPGKKNSKTGGTS
jgi:hypothetical protein